jgi:hypothetical protein
MTPRTVLDFDPLVHTGLGLMELKIPAAPKKGPKNKDMQ